MFGERSHALAFGMPGPAVARSGHVRAARVPKPPSYPASLHPTYPATLYYFPFLSHYLNSIMKQKINLSSITETDEAKYKQKCKDLKRRIQEIESSNDIITISITRTKQCIKRLKLEYGVILEKFENVINNDNDINNEDDIDLENIDGINDFDDDDDNHDGNKRVGVVVNKDTNGKYGIDAFSVDSNGDLSDTQSERSFKNETPTKKAHVKDPFAPKRPQNAYIIFCDREKIRIKNQLDSNQTNDSTDLTRALADAWKELDENGRKPYYELYEQSKARYVREMAIYVPNNPKSTEKEKLKAELALKDLISKEEKIKNDQNDQNDGENDGEKNQENIVNNNNVSNGIHTINENGNLKIEEVHTSSNNLNDLINPTNTVDNVNISTNQNGESTT